MSNPQYILGKIMKYIVSDISVVSKGVLNHKKTYLFTFTRHPNGDMYYTLPGNDNGVDGKWWFNKNIIKKIEINESEQPLLEGLFE